MNIEIARRLNRLNTEFYQAQAASFSQTRQAPWQGWERVVELAGISSCDLRTLSVLDVACGNLRFGDFLAHTLKPPCVSAKSTDVAQTHTSVAYYAVDNCISLARRSAFLLPWDVEFTHIDLVEELISKHTSGLLDSNFLAVDLSLCFGFMHHVPTQAARITLIRELLGATRSGGSCALSFWQFMNNPKLASRAQETTAEALDKLGMAQADLEPNDFLLGWQERSDVWRYCHHFDAAEIDALVDASSDLAELQECFSADGHTGNLNRYLVFRKKKRS
ncbi:class I SAM-dependent methyltransferase [uncultured Olegusella sp.]|uniref:class I SAM-dependent methyltransferase n=1 Tax=uncultured Olegusella sp. TaxID=1979846 RepID=UPI0026363CC1|nr:class I SAM-dependent methyltransferase [uncultured Olegusella sp.]